MVVASITLREDYWDTFEIQEDDISFINNYLLEVETPLTPDEIMLALVQDRLRREKKAIEERRSAGGDIYLPRESYKVGQMLVIPVFDWRQAKVTDVRPGVNPDLGKFDVIQVTFQDDEEVREFAAGLSDHPLNNPPEIAEDDVLLNPQAVMHEYGEVITERLLEALQDNQDFVYIAGRWFPKALLVDVNVGHLNLAEAVLDVAAGGPLPTTSLLEQVELPTDVNLKLVEFSLDLALQEDERFDEVGPAGKVLWFLRRLEPEEVLRTPETLRYDPIEYDPESLSDEMRYLEGDLDDELSPIEDGFQPYGEVEVRLIFPHWREGTLPLSARMKHLFPTAYDAPRIRLTLLEGDTGDQFPGWVVRKEKYVFGLKEWYEQRGMLPGSLLRIRRGDSPGEIVVRADTHRSTREWVRTVLIGKDGGLVLAMLKQVVTTNLDDRMAIAVPDPDAMAEIWKQNKKTPFEKVVVDMFRELAKLNPQSHVHVSELYAGVNLVRRCPPGPIMALLATRPWFVHLGDYYYRLTDFEAA